MRKHRRVVLGLWGIGLWLVAASPAWAATPLHVISPDGGETWKIGQKQTIQWTAGGKNSTVDILLCKEPGCGEQYPLVVKTKDDGTWVWSVGKTQAGTALPEGEYLIQVRRNDTGESAESDGPFTMVKKLVAPLPSSRACGGDEPCSCGDRVVADTVLSPTKDPVVSTSETDVCAGDGLIVASGVTLDLGGTTLRGTHTGGVGILAEDGASDFTIKNGVIEGFHDGIKVTDTARNLITKVTVARNKYFGILIGGSPQVSVDNRIEESAVLDNGGRGLRIRGHRAVLLRNRAERNGGYGFNIRANDAIIKENIAIDNKSACIHFDGSFGLVEANECYHNGWQGLGSDESHHNIYRNNILRGNIGPGLWLIGDNYLVVTDNVATENIGDGLQVLGMGNTIERNQADRNKQIGLNVTGNENYLRANTASNELRGIEVKPQGRRDNNRDGGGNTATDNDKKPECVIDGVPCLTNGEEIPPNRPPVVNAGSDQTIGLPAPTTLDGDVLDDGQPNPPGQLTTNWRKISGPGTVTFGDPSAVDTTVSFSTAGTYLLGLQVFDGQYSGYDDVTIQVEGD